MTDNKLNIPFKRKVKISFKGVTFTKLTKQPVKGEIVVSGSWRLNSKNSFTFSILSADKQKKERNSNYSYFSLK